MSNHPETEDNNPNQQEVSQSTLDPALANLTPDQQLILQQITNLHTLGMLHNYTRTVKRRKPVRWQNWEEKNLIEGVRRFGRGNWAQIRAAFEFQACRTNVDLHDKWRVLTGERKRARGSPRADEFNDDNIARLLEANKTTKENGEQNEADRSNNDQHDFSNLSLPFPPMINFDQHPELSTEFMAQMQALQEVGIQLPSLDELTGVMGGAAMQPRKRSKKNGAEDTIAQELLKLANDAESKHADASGSDESDAIVPKRKKPVAKKTARKATKK